MTHCRPIVGPGFRAIVLAGLAYALIGAPPLLGQTQAPAPIASNVQDLSAEAIDNIIASARPDVPATLTVANREIVVLRASLVGRSSAERVETIQRLVAELPVDTGPLRVTSRPVRAGAMVSVGGRDLFSIVPADTDQLQSETVEAKAAAAAARLQQALDEMAEARRPRLVLWAAVQALLATIVFVLALWGLRRANRWACATVARATERRLSHSSVGQIVHETQVLQYVKGSITISSIILALAVGYMWLFFVLRRFPYTRPWGESLRSFLLDRVILIGQGIVSAVPDLFTILLIVVVTRFAIRLVQVLFAAVEQARITLPGIYPETAVPTRKLVTGLLWLFALVVSYPYLPGSSTDAFKGVSVFVGLVVSLGSSGIVNQVMSGFTVTYSRALRVGDYVRVGDVEGTVTQLGTLSTKIETLRREDVTIPNTLLISQTMTNYSRYAATTGVVLPTSVTIGYDAPWRQVEALLLLAASRTPGIRTDPAPAVRQTALEDFYVRYTLLVCPENQHQRPLILHQLHRNIQDAFNEHGVQIMSPNYEADPGAPKIVPKEHWFAAPAERPGE
jgi:small-conductance mechanosensitive channel